MATNILYCAEVFLKKYFNEKIYNLRKRVYLFGYKKHFLPTRKSLLRFCLFWNRDINYQYLFEIPSNFLKTYFK